MATSIQTAVHNFLQMMDPNKGGVLPSGSQVIYRKFMPRYIAPLTLQVSEVHGEQEPAEMSPGYRREERYDMHCCLSYTSGGTQDADFLYAFDQVFNNFTLIETTIANNPWLSVAPVPGPGNGPVRFAQTIQLDYVPNADTYGKIVGELTFTVHCEARVSSLT